MRFQTKAKKVILPHFTQKSTMKMQFFQFSPPGWYPDVVIIEGMFMISTTPLRIHTKMVEYTKHLLVRYSGCYLNMGISEIHIIFDDTGRFGLNPK